MSRNQGGWRMIQQWVLTIGLAGVASADGFRNPPPGGMGLALGNAATAGSTGVESVFFNPANIAGIQQSEAIAALTLARRRTDFSSPDGRRASSTDDWQALPNLAFALPVERLGAALGFSLATPFGQASEWDAAGPFRSIAPHYARMEFTALTASIAVPLKEEISGGLGVSIATSSLTIKQMIPWAMAGVPAPDGEARIEADGLGIGAWAGATWTPAQGHRIGAVYRSPLRMEYEGDLTLGGHPGAAMMPPPLQGTSRRSDVSTTYTFPDILSLGYAVNVRENIVVEINAEWLKWSRFGDPTYEAGANSAVLAMMPPRPRNDWSDTWNWSVGAAWDLDESWTARAGFTRIRSPIPDRSFSPILPDANQDVYSIGMGYRRGPHALDVAYAYARCEDRRIDLTESAPLSGRYTFDPDLIAISYRVEFR